MSYIQTSVRHFYVFYGLYIFIYYDHLSHKSIIMVHFLKSILLSSLRMQYVGRIRRQQAHQQMKQTACTVLTTYLRCSLISILHMNPKY
jgi:hypothetical protein